VRANREARAERHRGRFDAGGDHRSSRFARRNHVNGRGTPKRVSHVARIERTSHERTSVHRIDSRTQDAEEIVSESRSGGNQ
jgi:hypothetical protein